jgi:hypothetical protein
VPLYAWSNGVLTDCLGAPQAASGTIARIALSRVARRSSANEYRRRALVSSTLSQFSNPHAEPLRAFHAVDTYSFVTDGSTRSRTISGESVILRWCRASRPGRRTWERGMVRVRRTPRNRASPRPFGRDDGVVDAMRTIATLSKRLQRLETRMTLSGEPLVIQVQYVSTHGSVDDGPRICVPGAAERRVGMERL